MRKNLSKVFQISYEDNQKHKKAQHKHTNHLIKVLRDLSVAKNPDELIDGMYEFFSEVGLTHAFIDQNEELERGEIMIPW
jgi:hypothetical protein